MVCLPGWHSLGFPPKPLGWGREPVLGSSCSSFSLSRNVCLFQVRRWSRFTNNKIGESRVEGPPLSLKDLRLMYWTASGYPNSWLKGFPTLCPVGLIRRICATIHKRLFDSCWFENKVSLCSWVNRSRAGWGKRGCVMPEPGHRPFLYANTSVRRALKSRLICTS
jgi:hypothetical protein